MLQLGVSKIDITPAMPIPLAGFAHRAGSFESVAAPLFARCFWMQDDAAPPIFLVTADLIWWGAGITAAIRARFPDVCVILHATHTHSGPQTAIGFAPELGLPSAAYLDALEAFVVAGAAEARENLEPVRVRTGSVNVALGINRRKLVNGEIRMAPNPDGPADPECAIIQFITSEGREKALLVHATCHPTTTDARAVSSEFCGHAMARLDAGRGSVAGFLQGFCGDVRPALIKDGEFYRGGQEEVRQLGDLLADAVQARLAAGLDPRPTAPLRSFLIRVELPFEESHPPVAAEMTCVRIASGLCFVTCNAEIVVEYGFLARKCGLIPLGYTNGMIGYVTTARQLEEGGYESRGAFPFFGMPAPFSLDAESVLRTAIIDASEIGT